MSKQACCWQVELGGNLEAIRLHELLHLGAAYPVQPTSPGRLDDTEAARHEGYIAGLEDALDLNQSWDAVAWATKLKALIDRAKEKP